MKILQILEDYKKYIKAAVEDIADDANHTGFKAGKDHPQYNKSDENGTKREQKRKKGIDRAVKLMTKDKK